MDTFTLPTATARARLWIFAIITCASGWIGLLVNRVLGTPDSMESPAALIWISTPLLAGALLAITDRSLRSTYVKSWGFGKLREYGIAIAAFPIALFITLGAGYVFGWLSLLQLGTYVGPIIAAIVPTIVKNVAEEGAWRGFLVPALVAHQSSDIKVWLISGTIWALWHLPYYVYLLDESLIRAVWDVPPLIYALTGILIMVCWAPLFSELRIRSGSILPGVIAHSIANLSQIPVSLGGLPITPGRELLVSPLIGVIHLGVIVAIGVALWKQRNPKLQSS